MAVPAVFSGRQEDIYFYLKKHKKCGWNDPMLTVQFYHY